MRSLTLIGVILVVLGIAAFVFDRVSFTERTTAVEVGPVQVTTERERSISIPNIAAGAAVAAGLIMIVMGSRRR
ncbi:MAG: hypothetical protein KF813_14365 [Trueperaceae bacterium]|nr:hypothetical protein [Trueperaceae bacterium]